jgi:hypothetical protein
MDRRSNAARVRSVWRVQGVGAWHDVNLKVSRGVGRPREGACDLGRRAVWTPRAGGAGAARRGALAGNRFNIGHFAHDLL